jgi:hypothetical protein
MSEREIINCEDNPIWLQCDWDSNALAIGDRYVVTADATDAEKIRQRKLAAAAAAAAARGASGQAAPMKSE